MPTLRPARRRRRAAALVEYGLIVAGVTFVTAAAVAILGHKTSDLIGAVAAILPGAHGDDNGPIVAGKLIETGAVGPGNSIAVDVGAIAAEAGNNRLGNNVGAPTLGTTLVVEAN